MLFWRPAPLQCVSCDPAGELIDRVSADGSITERQAAGRAEMVPGRAQAVGAGGEFNLGLSVVMAIAWFRVVRPRSQKSQIFLARLCA